MSETLFWETMKMVCMPLNVVWVSPNMVGRMKKTVSKPENIFWLTRKMIPAVRKIFAITQNMV
jgi:hypothetical protein